MTPAEFAIEIRFKIEAIRRDNRPLNVAAADTHAKMSDRIFVKGQASDGNGIGQYSTKDIWINPDKTATRNQKGFNPRKGKAGNTEFKTNPSRKRKTSYFEGWKGFRATQGLQTSVVDLNNTGDMFFDFAKTNLPFLDRVVQLNVNEYASTFTKDLNTKKASGNENHFNKTIFKLTASERANFLRLLELELKQALEL